jgi:hypothetical protein
MSQAAVRPSERQQVDAAGTGCGQKACDHCFGPLTTVTGGVGRVGSVTAGLARGQPSEPEHIDGETDEKMLLDVFRRAKKLAG